MSVVIAPPGHASAYLVRAAVTAPSVYNTQPWYFVADGDRGIQVYADPDRGMPRTDPNGRELVVSCGAALFNIRLAMRHLGFAPVVRPFPRPHDPTLLARVGWGPYARPTGDEQRMYGALRRRHTVRGPFRNDPLPAGMVDALRVQATEEGAVLHVVDDVASRKHLAALVKEAEGMHRKDPGHTAEQASWTWRSAQPRTDGVPADVSVAHPDCTGFAGRDYAGLTSMFPVPPGRWPAPAGLVAVLSTDRDDRLAWLRAGQALERILLYAAAQGVMAAFHTQPLEVARLRTRLRREFLPGDFPQMILRLGFAPVQRIVPRRPAAEVLLR
ncbi:Acg family FMN-binding oxidoreductase [Streptomyces sp. NPDC057877]|uniref:Acg family FMN-binding oxidoreductase n=1 Tax=Streptomyces sp. NPDC057877 TaxID=3346269 RepID=UPI0036930432